MGRFMLGTQMIWLSVFRHIRMEEVQRSPENMQFTALSGLSLSRVARKPKQENTRSRSGNAPGKLD